MVGPWVTEQLGRGYLAVNWEATVDEVAAVHPAPPEPVRAVRRDGAVAHRPQPPRLTDRRRGARTPWPTSRCPSSVRPSPRAPSRSGSRGRRHGRRGRAAVRGVDRQGRHRGAVAGRRHADRDPGAGGRHRRRRHRARRGRRRPAPRAPAAPRRAAPPRRRRRAGSRPRPAPSRSRPPPAGTGRRAPSPPAAGSRRRRAAPPRPQPAPRRAAGRRRRGPPRGAAPATASGNRLLSPVVRRLVAEHGLDPAAITGTGAGGRITRDDVLDHIDAGGSGAPGRRRPPPPAPRRARAAAAPAPAPAAAAPQPAPRRAAPRAPHRPHAGERDDGRAAQQDPQAHRRAHGDVARPRRPHAFSVVEVDYANVDAARGAVKDEWQGAGGLQPHLPAVHHPGRGRRARASSRTSTPASATTSSIVHNYVNLGIAVDLDYEGLHGAGHPRRRRQAAAGHRPRDHRPRRPGPHQEAAARRDHRRHVHDHQRRLGRHRC